MKAHVFFWPIFFYILIYNILARLAFKRLILLAPTYFESDPNSFTYTMSRSMAIFRMVRDPNLPLESHPSGFKTLLTWTRITFWTTPIVVLAMLVLLAIYVER